METIKNETAALKTSFFFSTTHTTAAAAEWRAEVEFILIISVRGHYLGPTAGIQIKDNPDPS